MGIFWLLLDLDLLVSLLPGPPTHHMSQALNFKDELQTYTLLASLLLVQPLQQQAWTQFNITSVMGAEVC